MNQLIIHSLLACQNVIINDRHCFECYGYDLLIDDDLKPWLIEVNASPSISADTIQDYDLKFGLLEDVYTVVDVEGKYAASREDGVPERGLTIWDTDSPYFTLAHLFTGTSQCRSDGLLQVV